MKGVENRTAVISSAVAYATPNGLSKVFLNKIEGKITEKERLESFPDWIAPSIDNTFGGGYNAIFLPNGWDKTLAEISPTDAIPWSYREKNFIATWSLTSSATPVSNIVSGVYAKTIHARHG